MLPELIFRDADAFYMIIDDISCCHYADADALRHY